MIIVSNNPSLSKSANFEAGHKFMGMLAHEMRTQIAGICTASNMLLNEKGNTTNTDFYLSHINCMGINVMQILKNMMAASASEDGKLITRIISKQIQIREWLKDHVNQYQLLLSTRSVKIKTIFHRAVPEYIITDEVKLGQILKNLIDNALKFAPSGTNIVIHICPNEKHGLQFKITDHGEGIPSDKISSLFQPFQAIDEGLGSMGLGLYISKVYANSLGGDLLLGKSDKKGTTFLFLINGNQFSTDENREH